MLDANLKAQLKGYMERATSPIEIVASLDDSAAAGQMRSLIADIADVSPLVSVREDNGADVRKPSFSLNRPDGSVGIRFSGLPMGHEFTSLVLALLQVGGYPPKVDADTIAQIKALDGDFNFLAGDHH